MNMICDLFVATEEKAQKDKRKQNKDGKDITKDGDKQEESRRREFVCECGCVNRAICQWN